MGICALGETGGAVYCGVRGLKKERIEGWSAPILGDSVEEESIVALPRLMYVCAKETELLFIYRCEAIRNTRVPHQGRAKHNSMWGSEFEGGVQHHELPH